jgi:transposase-like protein
MSLTPITSKPEIDPEVLRRVQRWQEEQKVRKEKQKKREEQAAKRGITVTQLMTQRKEQYLLKSCRATLGEIIKAHPLKRKA